MSRLLFYLQWQRETGVLGRSDRLHSDDEPGRRTRLVPLHFSVSDAHMG